MIRARDRQRQRPLRAFGFRQLARLRDFFRLAGNHQLSWTIQICQHHARFGADLARRRFVQANDRRHAAFGRFACFLHETPALTDDAQSVFKTHRARRRQLRVFCLGQIRFRPFKTNFGQIVAKRSIGAVEPRFRAGKFFGEVFAHADDLCALTGE